MLLITKAIQIEKHFDFPKDMMLSYGTYNFRYINFRYMEDM